MVDLFLGLLLGQLIGVGVVTAVLGRGRQEELMGRLLWGVKELVFVSTVVDKGEQQQLEDLLRPY